MTSCSATMAQGACATPASAPDPLPWCAGPERQAARPGSAATARAASPGQTARRTRGGLCASPPSAIELGQVAQAGVRDRDGALPELKRRAEDQCGDPGAAGDREEPYAPGVAGQGTASCAGPRPGSASGLPLPNRDSSGDPASRADGVGCIRAFAGPMEASWRTGTTRGRRPRRTTFGWAVTAQQSFATPTKTDMPSSRAVFAAPWLRKEGVRKSRLKILSSPPRPVTAPARPNRTPAATAAR